MNREFDLPNRQAAFAAALFLYTLLAAVVSGPAAGQAVTPVFTYQGDLRLSAGPANGDFDLEFRLFAAANGGGQIGNTVSANNVTVTGGLFAVPLDFGPAQFAGDRQWLEVRVRPAGAGSFETLTPRTELTAAPYAWGAAVALANAVTGISIVDGSVGLADINPAQVQRRVTGNCPTGQYVRAVNQSGTVTCGTDATGTSGWSLSGNAGTDPATDFIGTTDNQALVLRTANATSLRIEPSSETFGGSALPITRNMIGGSHANKVTAGVRGATIAGGGVPIGDSDPDFESERPNQVFDHYGVVGGGYANEAGGGGGNLGERPFATVAGGVRNRASGHSSVVAGGVLNDAVEFRSTIGGGEFNRAESIISTIAGGSTNTIRAGANLGTIGGGQLNTVGGLAATISGGLFNYATALHSTVVGGSSNHANATGSTVGGGEGNCAGGAFSWAGGRNAKIRPGTGSEVNGTACVSTPLSGDADGDNGTFIWGGSVFAAFTSTGPDQFLIRAVGGAAINSNDPAGNALRVNGRLRVDTLGTAGSTALCRNASNQIASCSSSARYKRDIEDLPLGLEAAARLRAVAYVWQDSGEADVGFVAEEVAAIDERLVTRNGKGQVEGVKYERLTTLLATALQELLAREQVDAAAIDQLSADNAALRARLDAIEARLGLAPERR